MRELRLVAVDEDGSHLLLRHDGEEPAFRLAIDDRLHAALRGDRARLGQLEIQIDSQLRPRDIQARVRGGDSVEAVAQAAGVPLDRILRFARPVLAEREHVADQARRARVRRLGGDGPNPILDDAVTAHVAAGKGDPEAVSWDAWRREDGRWMVTASWQAGGKTHTAHWSFDLAGRSVLAEDALARAVAGERREPATAPASPPAEAPAARLAVVKEPEEAAAEASDETPTAPVPVVAPAPEAAGSPPRRRRRDDTRLRLTDLASHVEEVPAEEAGRRPVRNSIVDAVGPSDARDDAGSGPAGRAAAGRHKGRPSVPSWDEIMFGRRRRSGD